MAAAITEPMKKYQALSAELVALRKKIAELEGSHRADENFHVELDTLEDESDSLLDRMDPVWNHELSENDIRLLNLFQFEGTLLELLENIFSADPERVFVPIEELVDKSVIVDWFFKKIWKFYVDAWKAEEMGEKIAHLNVTVDFDGARRK